MRTVAAKSQYQTLALTDIHESTTNPRRTFDESKLAELAESLRTQGLIQPITVRPNSEGYEIVAGARRFRAAHLAEIDEIPVRIVQLSDEQALEWQLIENSQRVDVHPYEEAQGFQRLLDLPGYDVATLAEKTGKSDSLIYARLALLQLIPEVAEAFQEERITASHANLIARLPQDSQKEAFDAMLAQGLAGQRTASAPRQVPLSMDCEQRLSPAGRSTFRPRGQHPQPYSRRLLRLPTPQRIQHVALCGCSWRSVPRWDLLPRQAHRARQPRGSRAT